MNKQFRIVGILLVGILALVAAGCSSDSQQASSVSVAKVSCSKVGGSIKVAKVNVSKAQGKVKDSKGTPDENQAKAQLQAAQTQVKALVLRSKECDPKTVNKPVDKACKASWKRSDANTGGHRWFQDGIQSIKDATTPEQAQSAAHDWLVKVRTDPVLLKGASAVLIHKDVDQTQLFDANGCATSVAVGIAGEIEVALSLSQITPSEAPANGVNSGVDGGQVVAASAPGIGGDRKAILVVLPDGTKVWVMARCGNTVTEGQPPLPPGQTDTCPGFPNEVPDSNGVCPKHGEQSSQANPAVYPPRRGPGTTPTGTPPGTASEPVRTPTGCPEAGCGSTPPPTTPPPTHAPTTVTPPATQPPNTGTVPPPPPPAS